MYIILGWHNEIVHHSLFKDWYFDILRNLLKVILFIAGTEIQLYILTWYDYQVVYLYQLPTYYHCITTFLLFMCHSHSLSSTRTITPWGQRLYLPLVILVVPSSVTVYFYKCLKNMLMNIHKGNQRNLTYGEFI